MAEDEFIDEDENDFSEENEILVPGALFSDLNISTTDWTIETIISQLTKGNIELNPDFQRRKAWTSEKRNRFIESLVLGLPIPQLVIAADRKNSGKFIVIDGKQRLSTLLSFCTGDGFVLTELPVLKDLNGLNYQVLKSDPVYRKYLDSFENNTIRTTQIKNWKSEGFLYLAFLRLNTGSVPLSSQELRQALKPGPFTRWANLRTVETTVMQAIMGIKDPDFRMRDVELLIRYFAYKLFFQDYKGNLKTFLDNCCDSLNTNFDETNLLHELDMLVLSDKLVRIVFGKNAYRKFKDQKYESSFNRAIYDIMTYYFSSGVFSESSVTIGQNSIRTAFETLCSTDASFLEALETTTKSVTSVNNRFIKWGEALVTLGFSVSVPSRL